MVQFFYNRNAASECLGGNAIIVICIEGLLYSNPAKATRSSAVAPGNRQMDGLQFYILFNSISAISEQWVGKVKGCLHGTLFTIEKISAKGGLQIWDY